MRCRLDLEQPAKYAETAIDEVRPVELAAGDDEGLRDAAVVVRHNVFEPRPIFGFVHVEGGVEAVGQGDLDLAHRVIVRNGAQVIMQPENTQRPGPRITQCFNHGDRTAKQVGGKLAGGVTGCMGHEIAQGPHDASLAIIAFLLVQPPTVVGHHVPEAIRFRDMGVMQEPEVAIHVSQPAIILEERPSHRRDDERPRVVVRAVTVVPVGRAVDGVLEYAGIVGHGVQMVRAKLRQRHAHPRSARRWTFSRLLRVGADGFGQSVDVLPSNVRPDHRAATIVRGALHG